jgi:predicted transcriptional regulator
MKTLQDVMNSLPSERKQRVNAMAERLIHQELSLRELRQSQNLTQKDLARLLEIGQEGVSRLEKRKDILLSTLEKYVQAIGGHLKIVVEFDNQPSVDLIISESDS